MTLRQTLGALLGGAALLAVFWLVAALAFIVDDSPPCVSAPYRVGTAQTGCAEVGP